MQDNSIPYIAYESAMATSERHIKRLWIALIICMAMLFVSNAMWVYYFAQYDYVSTTETTTYSQDGQGTNIIGNLNEVE
jgi:TRAP-type C4-dicarboxylate transport system permease large subunit